MTQYDDDADRLSEECEFCGELNVNCTCEEDEEPCPRCGTTQADKHKIAYCPTCGVGLAF